MADRFDGLAARYQRFRPRYPRAALDAIAMALGHVATSAPVLLDVGAGTGISTRALARTLGRRWQIVGVEPGADMRKAAIGEPENPPSIAYVDGTAAALPADDRSIDAVTVAQALHWFDRPAFYGECERVLTPGGLLFVLYNDRDPAAPVFQAFEDLMEREVPGYRRDYRTFDYRAELQGLAWTEGVRAAEFTWHWRLSISDFAGLMLSRSLAKPWVASIGEAAARRILKAFVRPYGSGETVELPYLTRLVGAARR